jgi:hypothetical protein
MGRPRRMRPAVAMKASGFERPSAWTISAWPTPSSTRSWTGRSATRITNYVRSHVGIAPNRSPSLGAVLMDGSLGVTLGCQTSGDPSCPTGMPNAGYPEPGSARC